MKKTVVLITFLLATIYCYCQPDSAEQGQMHMQAGLQFISNQTYAGRTDSLELPLLIPEFNLQFGKGFFVNTKGYVNMSGGKTSFDGVTIEPGWEFSTNNWNGSFSVIKNFMSDSSNLIIAPVNTSLELYLNKETKIVTPYIGSEYVFSAEGNDLIVYGGLSKNIIFSKDDAKTSVNAEPAIGVTAGSQNFYYSFLKSYAGNGQSRGKGNSVGRGRGNGGNGSTTTASSTAQQQSQTFSLLSSSFELPFTVTAHKFKWSITPALEMPVNLLQATTGGQTSSSVFYITSELLFNFW
jgi:hypothetical protein